MAKAVSPSAVNPISIGQAAKFLDLQMAALRKSGLPSGPTQQVLESQGAALADEFVTLVRRRVEAISDLIVRVVAKVDRSRTPQEALDATGRTQYVDRGVAKAMPRGTGEGAKTEFFELDLSRRGGWISDSDLDKEYALRGLVPEDPYSLAAQNEADPAFADEHPNATHWKDANGSWCYAAFFLWRDERYVRVHRCDSDWLDRWWFAGRRK